MEPPAQSDVRDSAAGQVFEFRLWAELIQQSGGLLHVFLPLLDRGLDAVLHRLTDGAYIPIQAKCRTSSRWREVHVVVRDEEMTDDTALLVAGRLHDGDLGPYLLVVSQGTFKRLAYGWTGEGGRHEAWFHEGPDPGNRWDPYVVPRATLGSALLALPAAEALAPAPAVSAHDATHNRWLGFMGEAEVIRQLAAVPDLDLFRPFPDTEMVEVLVRGHENGRFAGLQVKTEALEPGARQVHADIAIATWKPDPTTFVTVLVWLPEEGRFHPECLLLPAAEVSKLAMADGRWYLIEFQPGSLRGSRYDSYRTPLAELGASVSRLLSGHTMVPMPGAPTDPDFTLSRVTDPEEVATLPAATSEAVAVIESCIAERHAVELEYSDEAGTTELLRVWPAFIRTSRAGYVVLWAMSPAEGHWLQLRIDRVQAARDTGEVFKPSW